MEKFNPFKFDGKLNWNNIYYVLVYGMSCTLVRLLTNKRNYHK